MGADLDQRPGRREDCAPDTAERTSLLTAGRMPAARTFGVQGGHQTWSNLKHCNRMSRLSEPPRQSLGKESGPSHPTS